jgi:hypothetical protein
MDNTTDFDMLMYLNMEKLNPIEYFDVNKMIKLKDKLTSEVGVHLSTVVDKLKKLVK